MPTRALLGGLLYFPSRQISRTPADAGLEFRDLWIELGDRERLGAWWISAHPPRIGHLLFCHGNGGNIADRVGTAALLSAAGLDVLLFDYRGYGRSTGHPDEPGTYEDARAARVALLAQADVDPSRVFYLGESLGGAVALALALETPPRGLILQSTFTSVRDVAAHHYSFVPRALVPDAYPSLRRIRSLNAPLLVLHGDRDQTVPPDHGRSLYEAAPAPKRLHIFPGLEHDVAAAAMKYADTIADWVKGLGA